MAESTLLIALVGLATLGAAYFFLSWVYELLRLRGMTYIELRNAQIAEELTRERQSSQRERLRMWMYQSGLGGDPAPLAMGIAFGYLLIAAVLSLLGFPSLPATIIALPAAAGGVFFFVSRKRRRMYQNSSVQVLQLLRSVVTYLESGSTPQQAFNKAAIMLENPLRDDLLNVLASRVAAEPLSQTLQPIAEKYPSQAMTLLIAAMEINDQVGAKLAPTLRQAAHVVEQQLELAAEATAEVSQAKGEFIGVTAIIGLVGLMMLLSSGQAAREAYTSFIGIFVLALGLGNFALGVWRTMRTLKLAGSGKL